MSATPKTPELAIPREAPANAVEQAKCLKDAARLVHGFAQKCAPNALDALLAANDAESPGQAAELARAAAEAATSQTETLLAEVEHFLALTRPKA